jgi:hypothetical protein
MKNKIIYLFKISQAIYFYPLSNDDELLFKKHVIKIINSPTLISTKTKSQELLLDFIFNTLVKQRERERIEAMRSVDSKGKYFAARYKSIYAVVNKQPPHGLGILLSNFVGWLNQNHADNYSKIISEALESSDI